MMMHFIRFVRWNNRWRSYCGRNVIIFATVLILFGFRLLSIINTPMDDRHGHGQQQKEHRLCVTIPFRDRWNELERMIPLLHKFLLNQLISPTFIVVNQTDELRFNRASLINIASLEAERVGCDYIAIHDVDIGRNFLPFAVPLNPNLSYRYPMENIMHLASGKYHPVIRYDYKTFIGGILLITLVNFKKVNGMSNDYWGWGLEDDDFYLRLRDAGLATNITRPMDLNTNRTNTFLHLHTKGRKRDYSKEDYRRKRRRRRDNTSGLANIHYTLQRRRTINLEDTELLILDVKLFCSAKLTPYCLSSSL